MKFVRWTLIIGGIFNCVMGIIFFSNTLLSRFLIAAENAERALFSQMVVVHPPSDPVHQLLIHGFGAAAMILGAMLIFSARDPLRFISFILFDGVGRLLYGSMMLYYVGHYSLMNLILIFGIVEIFFGIVYIAACWKLAE